MNYRRNELCTLLSSSRNTCQGSFRNLMDNLIRFPNLTSAASVSRSTTMTKRKKQITPPLSPKSDDSFEDAFLREDRHKNGKPRPSANARERERMRVLSKAFSRLKTTLPWVPADTKLSKLDTLRLACSYIAHLKQILDEDSSAVQTKGDASMHPVALVSYRALHVSSSLTSTLWKWEERFKTLHMNSDRKKNPKSSWTLDLPHDSFAEALLRKESIQLSPSVKILREPEAPKSACKNASICRIPLKYKSNAFHSTRQQLVGSGNPTKLSSRDSEQKLSRVGWGQPRSPAGGTRGAQLVLKSCGVNHRLIINKQWHIGPSEIKHCFQC